MEAPRELRYADGSGNAFVFERRDDGAYAYRYAPVRPAMSSTGFFSGGEPRGGVIALDEVSALWSRLLELCSGPLLDHRAKGSGLLVFEAEDGEERRIFERSAALTAFEEELAKYRG